MLIFLVPLLLILLYFAFRNAEWRGVDFARLSTYWQLVWYRIGDIPRRIGDIPERVEPLFIRTGMIRYRPVPIRLSYGIVMLLDPSDVVDRSLVLDGAWEQIEWGWINANLHEGDTFVDVGAHHGTYALRAAKSVGPNGKVIAIEPNPPTIRRLRENILLNRMANIVVEEVACGDKEGMLTLFSSAKSNTGMASLSRENASNSGGLSEPHEVRIVPLDKLLSRDSLERSQKHIAVIKIDTEGAETMVLRGAGQTLKSHRPALVIETMPNQLENMGSSLKELEALLYSFGYERVAATSDNALWKHK